MFEKKVLLFIVEGTSDKISFQSILENFFEKFYVKVAVMYCDITIKDFPVPAEMKKIMSDRLNEFCKREKIHFPDDIIKIIHLIDTDGAFIQDNCIQSKNNGDIEYTINSIITKNPEFIKKRNKTKCAIVNKLATMGTLNSVEYKVYYFSRNLEHVLHNRSGSISKEEKTELSEKFDDTYADDLEGFLEFIKDPNFSVQGTYKETWNFIKQSTNSLNRYSNFHLLFVKD